MAILAMWRQYDVHVTLPLLQIPLHHHVSQGLIYWILPKFNPFLPTCPEAEDSELKMIKVMHI